MGRRHSDAELLEELAHYARLGALIALELTARKLPEARQVLTRPATGHEQPPLIHDDGSSDGLWFGGLHRDYSRKSATDLHPQRRGYAQVTGLPDLPFL